ncbi:MAG: hypothetical protein ACI9HY_003094, partial [Planctomycetaceae bacterium]
CYTQVASLAAPSNNPHSASTSLTLSNIYLKFAL